MGYNTIMQTTSKYRRLTRALSRIFFKEERACHCQGACPSPLPLPLEVGPLIQLGGLWELCKLPSGIPAENAFPAFSCSKTQHH